MRTSRRVSLVSLALAVGGVAAGAQQASSVKVVVARVDARVEPNDTSRVIDPVTYGQSLELRSVADGYARVLVRNPRMPTIAIDGYVRADLVNPAAAGPAKPFETPGISVSADFAGKTLWLSPVETRAVPVIEPVTSIRTLGESALITSALDGKTVMPAESGDAVSWVWLIPSDAKATVISDPRPALMGLYAQAEGVSINDIAPVLVRLAPAGPKWSIVTVARTQAGAPVRAIADWLPSQGMLQELVKVDTKVSGPGFIEIRPSAPLAPGDYAFVLRPAGGKRYAGDQLFATTGDGLAFRAAWKITIK